MLEEKEKEIDIKDMLFRVLEKWRWMIVWAVIMAVALAGLKYLKDKRSSHEGEDTDEVLSVMMEDMTPSERSNVETYIALYDNLEMLRKDIDTRLIYQIDPYHEKALQISYAVKLPEVEKGSGEYIIAQHLSDATKINQLTTMYSNYVMSSDFVDEIAKAVPEISESDLRTLISIVNNNNNNNNNGVVNIKIIYTEDMDVEGVAGIVKSNIEAYSESLQETEKHDIVISSEYKSEIIDDSLINTQNNLISREYSLQTQLNSLNNSLGNAEKEYIEVYADGKDEKKVSKKDSEEEESVAKDKSSTGISIKYAILGAMVGVFLVCMWELMRYILSGKLHTVDTLSEFYGLQVFGVQAVSDKNSKKKGIDKLLFKIENRKKKVLTFEAQKEIISSSIKLALEQQDVKEIVLTGTDVEKLDESYLNELKEELTKNGVKTSVENNIYYYPEALKKATEIKNVILFETIDMSIEYEIENILQKAVEYDIRVLGVVAFEKA